MSRGDGILSPLEGMASTLFAVAGVVFLATATNTGLVYLVDGYESTALTLVLLPVALLAAVLGLCSLYPALSEDTPRLAVVSVAVAILASVDVAVLIVWELANAASLGPDPSPVVVATTPILITVGFILFGVATLRADAYASIVGGLLLAEGVTLVALIAVPVLLFEGEAPMWGAALIEGIQAVILLGTGYLLREGSPKFDREDPASADRPAT